MWHPICYKYYNKYQHLHRKLTAQYPEIYIVNTMTDNDETSKLYYYTKVYGSVCNDMQILNYVLIKNNSVVVHFNFHYRSSLQLKFIRLYDLITLECLVILKHTPSYSLL